MIFILKQDFLPNFLTNSIKTFVNQNLLDINVVKSFQKLNEIVLAYRRKISKTKQLNNNDKTGINQKRFDINKKLSYQKLISL